LAADPVPLTQTDSSEAEGSSVITKRSLIVGIGMAVLMPFWPTYTSLILHSTRADHSHLSMAMLIPFVALLVINAFLERRGIGFSPTELLTVCCIGFVAAIMQGEWITVWFLQMLTMPAYYASAENRFDEFLLPHMPDWTTITNREAVRGFYEGLVPGTAFPWSEWFTVLFWWGALIASILCIHLCLSVLLRKQWMEYEKLSFPVATAMLELTGVSGSTGTLRTLAGNRLFQWGFGLTLAIIGWNVFTWFTINLPMFPFLAGRYGRHVLPIAPGFPSIVTTFVLLTFCLGYFCKLEVLFSLWFFHGINILIVGIMNRFGLDLGANDPYSSAHPAMGFMTFGGMIVFVGWGFWIARDHFRDIFKKAFLNDETVDDSDEIMSYRTATFMFIICSLFSIIWFLKAGMGFGPTVAWSFAMLILFVGMSRIVVESGLVYLRVPLTAQGFTWHVFGPGNLGPQAASILTLTMSLVADGKGFAMTQMAHVPRFSMAMAKRSRRSIAPTVLGGCLLGAAVVIGFVIYQGYYGVGSANFGRTTFQGVGSLNGAGFSRLAVSRLQDAATKFTEWNRLGFMGIGSVITAVLYYLRYRFTGFPIHPIGFTICGMVEMQDNAFSIFLMWATKSIIMQLGGLTAYRRYAPFFLGMIMGYVTGVAIGAVSDVFFFPGEGHEIHCDP
tara:strand:+ start:1985 stop:3997 length:2013 start_codon:yes stop_codon:yes gene_type:complete